MLSSLNKIKRFLGIKKNSEIIPKHTLFSGKKSVKNLSNSVIFKRTLVRDRFGNVECVDDVTDTDDHDRFYEIAQKFDQDNRRVICIEFVVNQAQHEKYNARKIEFSENNISTKEILVFHGTRKKNIKKIITDGFKVGGVDGHESVNGSAYGKGIYTSTVAETPVSYADNPCVVALKCLPGNKEQHCTVPRGKPTWLILHSSSQTLPCYVIYFKTHNDYADIPCRPFLKYGKVSDSSEDENVTESVVKGIGTLSDTVLSPETLNHIRRELKKLLNIQCKTSEHERGWRIDVENMDDFTKWKVHILHFNGKLAIYKDLEKAKLLDKGIEMEILFEKDFPLYPPFVRVVTPRLRRFQNGGGGHVTAGGAICLDILTSGHWKSDFSIESILQIVRMLLSTKLPPARLASNFKESYSLAEAKDAFVRVAKEHNWEI